MHDFEPGWDTYIERKGYLLESDISFADVNAEEYEAVLIPGGRAPEYLRNDAAVIKIVKEFWKSGKYIFAICHGVQILVTAGLVNQKKIACYEHGNFEVESCGGIYVTPDEAVKTAESLQAKHGNHILNFTGSFLAACKRSIKNRKMQMHLWLYHDCL